MTAAITEWRPTQRDLIRAEDDLEWWHSLSDSALGAHACGFESGGTKWDDAAIWRLFEQVFEPRRIQAVKRFYRVAPLLGALDGQERERAEWIYRARPYPGHLRILWPCDRDAPGVVTLVGAALRTTAVRNAFEKAHGDKPASGTGELLAWADKSLQWQSSKPKWAKSALTEARQMREDLLTAYAAAQRGTDRGAYWA